MVNSDNMLSFLESLMAPDNMEVAHEISSDLRARRIEKNLTREQLADKAGISVSNIVRFEQKGLISLTNFIAVAIAMGYLDEIKNIFKNPKYSTMEELMQIRRNSGRKKAHKKIMADEKNRKTHSEISQ